LLIEGLPVLSDDRQNGRAGGRGIRMRDKQHLGARLVDRRLTYS
jgi:hypothetical protein